MGRLNSFIKFVVVNVNALLFLGGLGMIIVASLVLDADFIKLARTYMQIRGISTLIVGILVAAMSVIGCVGTHRQIQRDRIWSGRRMLSLYQVILLAVVVGHGLVQMKLYSTEVSLTEAAEYLPDEYGEFENRFREGFNKAFYSQLCPASGGDSWVWSLVDTYCPDAISQDSCSCPGSFGGGGLPLFCSVSATYTTGDCCPDESICKGGKVEACPYDVCRSGILDGLLNYITPARKYSTFVFVLEGLVLILTCLLICYNPRDSTEDILIKTGTIMLNKAKGMVRDGSTGGGGGGAGSSEVDLEADVFETQLAQPAAARAAQRAAADSRRVALGRSTPPISPVTIESATSEPLRQFMIPRRSKGMVVFTPDSPTERAAEDTAFEYHNPRRTSKSGAVGPPRSVGAPADAAAAAATRAVVAKGGRTRGSLGVSRTATGDARAAVTATAYAAATVAGGLVSAAAPSRLQEEHKDPHERDDKDGGEKKERRKDDGGREGDHSGGIEWRPDDGAGGKHDSNGEVGGKTSVFGHGEKQYDGEVVPPAPRPAATLDRVAARGDGVASAIGDDEGVGDAGADTDADATDRDTRSLNPNASTANSPLGPKGSTSSAVDARPSADAADKAKGQKAGAAAVPPPGNAPGSRRFTTQTPMASPIRDFSPGDENDTGVVDSADAASPPADAADESNGQKEGTTATPPPGTASRSRRYTTQTPEASPIRDVLPGEDSGTGVAGRASSFRGQIRTKSPATEPRRSKEELKEALSPVVPGEEADRPGKEAAKMSSSTLPPRSRAASFARRASFGRQVSSMSPAMETNRKRGSLRVSISSVESDEDASGLEEEEKQMAEISSGVPSRFRRFSAQTPIASPPDASPPLIFTEPAPVPPSTTTEGSPTENTHDPADSPPTLQHGTAASPEDSAADPQKHASAQPGMEPAAPGRYAVHNDADTRQRAGTVDASSSDDPASVGRRGRFSAQTPIGGMTTAGVSTAAIGTDAPASASSAGAEPPFRPAESEEARTEGADETTS